ncbi:MAG: SDR family oxidoreductase [Clostridiales bacterium]|jgi:NAD(P)-dependent dehydrogenase (short-subunit alcohol dehydrogenase family)|nr:SDR family oxidoreductase [Clostridiales bacterium]
MSNRLDMTGKIVVVTGARQGLGKVFAKAFAEEGAKVILMARNVPALRAASDEITKETGATCHICPLNVLDEDSVEQAAAFVAETTGRMDVLINNAAVGRSITPLQDVALEEWENTIGTNLTGTFLCMKHFGRLMIAQNHGVIINLGSLAAKTVFKSACTGAYDVSKAAIMMLTRLMAGEWAQYNIRVNSISPGLFMTDINRGYVEKHPAFYEKSLEHLPIKRWGHPEELATLVLFLASDSAAYVTGEDYGIDGGYPLW